VQIVELHKRTAAVLAPMQTLLVVENDDAFRYEMIQHLTEAGYVVIPVRTTMEALDVIDSKCRFDALLIDIYMPREDAHGIAVARMA
jgi:CheY-like chemotaxis protein